MERKTVYVIRSAHGVDGMDPKRYEARGCLQGIAKVRYALVEGIARSRDCTSLFHDSSHPVWTRIFNATIDKCIEDETYDERLTELGSRYYADREFTNFESNILLRVMLRLRKDDINIKQKITEWYSAAEQTPEYMDSFLDWCIANKKIDDVVIGQGETEKFIQEMSDLELEFRDYMVHEQLLGMGNPETILFIGANHKLTRLRADERFFVYDLFVTYEQGKYHVRGLLRGEMEQDVRKSLQSVDFPVETSINFLPNLQP